MDKKEKKSLLKRPIVWIILAIILIIIAVPKGGDNSGNPADKTPTTTQEQPKEEIKKLSLQETYDKLTTGMAKTDVEAIIGKDTGTCTVTEAAYVGKLESCNYGSAVNNIFDGGMIMITYQNDKLDSKTISQF